MGQRCAQSEQRQAKEKAKMIGSLDNPPIVIRQSRLKIGLMALLSAVLASFLYLLFHAGLLKGSPYPAEGLIAVFSLGVPFLAWLFLNPETMIVGPSGIVWSGWRKTIRYRWDDLDNFFVWYGPYLYNRVGVTFSKSYLGFLKEGTLGQFWELRPAKMVEILNQAKKKWRNN